MREEAWIWEAELNDGTFIKQYPALPDETETNFGEVLEAEKAGNLKSFRLVNDEENSYIFDKKTGVITDEDKKEHKFKEGTKALTNKGYDYRLIYFRRVTRQFNVGKANVEIVPKDFKYAQMSFFIGWQTTLDGKNVKRVLEVQPRRKIGESEELAKARIKKDGKFKERDNTDSETDLIKKAKGGKKK